MDWDRIKSLKERVELRRKEIEYYDELVRRYEKLREFAKVEYFKELERVGKALENNE